MMITLLLLFACQENEASTDDLDSLRTRITNQELTIALLLERQSALLISQDKLLERLETIEDDWDPELPTRVETLETELEQQVSNIGLVMQELTDQSYRITLIEDDINDLESSRLTVADLTGYATEIWTSNQGFATETWVQNQGYGLDVDINANSSSIVTNTQYINVNNGIAINNNVRLNIIESVYNTHLSQVDLTGYATELWVSQNYGLGVDMQTLLDEQIDHSLTLQSHTNTLTDLEERFIIVENDYVTAADISTFATQDWLSQNYTLQSDFANSELYQDQAILDISNLQSDLNIITFDYLTSSELIGYATQDWVSSNAALGSIVSNLSDYVSVDTNNDSIVFSGANVFFQSGSGNTADGLSQGSSLLGLGNLIVGYNESTGTEIRTGSHNLIVGDHHSYEGFAGFVAGKNNSLQGEYNAVLGGKENVISGNHSTISGGYQNLSSGNHAAILGGHQNEASNSFTTVLGGGNNIASGSKASVLGGTDNIALGNASAILGGDGNQTTGLNSTISGGVFGETVENYSNIAGGYSNTTTGSYSSILGGAENIASGDSSAILGGYLNQAVGLRSSISAGYSNIVNSNYSSISGGYLNIVDGLIGSVSGGAENSALGEYSSVSGGFNNTSVGNYTSLLGGNGISLSGLHNTSP